jgi:hypothetical protein
VLGTGLTESAGTLSAAAASGVTSITAGGMLSGGTITGTGTIGLAAPAAGLVLSTGSALSTATVGAGLSLSSGTLTSTGASVPSAGMVASNGSSLVTASLAGGLSYSAGTLTGASTLTLTDGTHTVSNVATITTNGTVSGSGGHGTLTIASGGGGLPAYLPGIGNGIVSGVWDRPALSSLSWLNQHDAVATDISGGPISILKPQSSTSFDFYVLGETPSTAFTASFLISLQAQVNTWRAGVAIVNTSGTGTLCFFGLHNGNTLIVDTFTGINSGLSSFASEPQSGLALAFSPSLIWLQVQSDGTNATFSSSYDNVTYTEFFSGGVSGLIGGAINVVGVASDALAAQNGGLTINLWSRKKTGY